MYDNLSLYYLNQIGIIPWEIRALPLKKTMVIIIPNNLSSKEKALIQSIKFLGNQEDFKVEQREINSSLEVNETIVLDFYINQLNQQVCPNLNDLLQNPKAKKNLFLRLFALFQQPFNE